jgi:predicted DNA-binding protein with PD1-like motif
MITRSADIQRLIVVRLSTGEDVLESIRNAVAENGVRTGAVLSGVGSVSRYRVHVVETVNMPPGDVLFGEDGPYDILSITGLVIDGRVHAHITLSNTQKALGGHLEEGCRILTFGVVLIAEMAETVLTDWDRPGQL